MDDYLLHELGRSLYSLERNGDGLKELLTFHRGSSTTDTLGRVVCCSKPPVNLTVLDLLVQTEGLLSFCFGRRKCWRVVMMLWARCLTGSRLRPLGCSDTCMWQIVCRGVR